MSQVGTFKINRTFELTGRGLVLVGDLLAGYVNRDNVISLPTDVDSVTLKIISVEAVDTITEKKAEVGLIIQPVSTEVMLAISATLGMACAIIKQST
jgi:selenocysteine-specific translation elongation factor